MGQRRIEHGPLDQRGIGDEGRRDRTVELTALRRQQARIRRFAEQRVPEPDHVTAGVDGQHLRVHRDPEGVVDGARGSVHDSHQEIRRRVVAEHRRRRDDLRGVDRERIEPHRQHVGNRRGQAVGAVQVRVQQFRREERIATRSPPELIEEVLRGIDIGTGPDECAELVAFEAAELDAFDGGQARDRRSVR